MINDPTSGLYYARNRYYHPGMGRFISQDPMGLAGGLNLYAYAGNDPINFRDPLGLFEVGGTAGSPLFDFDFDGAKKGLATGASAVAAAASDRKVTASTLLR